MRIRLLMMARGSLLLLSAVCWVGSPAQAAPWLQSPDSRPEVEIRITQRGLLSVAPAREVPLAAVAKTLERVLKVPVRLGEDLKRSRVSLRGQANASLAEVLPQLAPFPYIHERERLGESPSLIAVHLSAVSLDGRLGGGEGIALMGSVSEDGSTGDGQASGDEAVATSPPLEGPFLQVSWSEDGRLTIEARDQGLGVLLQEVARGVGARLDLRLPEAPVVGRLTVAGILPSELPGYVGVAGVGVEVRRNLTTGREELLRCFVEPTPNRPSGEAR